MNTIIYDMASLKYRWNADKSALSVFSPQAELLAQVQCPKGTSDREGVFLVLDAALASARIKRNDAGGARGLRRLALYNPYTAQVALGSVPRTETYGDGHTLSIPAEGLPGRIEDGLLWVSDRVLSRLELDYEDINAALSAHVA